MNLNITASGTDQSDLQLALDTVRDALQTGSGSGNTTEDTMAVRWTTKAFQPSLALVSIKVEMAELFERLNTLLEDDAVGCPNHSWREYQDPSIVWLVENLLTRTSGLVDEFLGVLTAHHQGGRLAYRDAVERLIHAGPD